MTAQVVDDVPVRRITAVCVFQGKRQPFLVAGNHNQKNVAGHQTIADQQHIVQSQVLLQ
jgi:hypothetical protein